MCVDVIVMLYTYEVSCGGSGVCGCYSNVVYADVIVMSSAYEVSCGGSGVCGCYSNVVYV